MSSICLTREEIIDITKRVRSDAQKKELNALGIKFGTRSDGSIMVLRSHVDKEYDGLVPKAAGRRIGPNLENINVR
jgi:hypothetical protein